MYVIRNSKTGLYVAGSLSRPRFVGLGKARLWKRVSWARQHRLCLDRSEDLEVREVALLLGGPA